MPERGHHDDSETGAANVKKTIILFVLTALGSIIVYVALLLSGAISVYGT